jgi:hypothetical protein
MTFRVEVVCLHDGGEQRCSVAEMERAELALETFGMSIAEGKAILHGIQDFVAAQQVIEGLKRKRVCANCGQRYHSKEAGTHTVKTVFGAVEVPNPRWERCPCQTEGPRTFRPSAAWLLGARTSPEMLYLETKWASLIPFEKVVDLLKEVLPVAEATNSQTVREHLHAVAERIEQELGEDRQPRDFATVEAIAELPLPDGPMTVGIDGGYVRAAHKQGNFEVIAGRSVVAFRREEGDSVPPPKCFGFVQTYDQKPRQRVWEVMKSQGMQENQQVVFMSDGGEDVRQVQEYLHPNSEHLIDWFHITMRLTVLQQQTKGLQADRPNEGLAASKQIESIKHLLWHGNADEALDRIDNLFMDLDQISRQSGPAAKLAAGISDLRTYGPLRRPLPWRPRPPESDLLPRAGTANPRSPGHHLPDPRCGRGRSPHWPRLPTHWRERISARDVQHPDGPARYPPGLGRHSTHDFLFCPKKRDAVGRSAGGGSPSRH